MEAAALVEARVQRTHSDHQEGKEASVVGHHPTVEAAASEVLLQMAASEVHPKEEVALVALQTVVALEAPLKVEVSEAPRTEEREEGEVSEAEASEDHRIRVEAVALEVVVDLGDRLAVASGDPDHRVEQEGSVEEEASAVAPLPAGASEAPPKAVGAADLEEHPTHLAHRRSSRQQLLEVALGADLEEKVAVVVSAAVGESTCYFLWYVDIDRRPKLHF
mmetsp:Transcript_59938/g.131399  ORF Transcript_59938/g.131399 Transcript_59938/m.131399 type:complete len:220 (+) Transcript_59938:1501-2160(+)